MAAVLLAALLATTRVGADTNTPALLLPPLPKCPVDFFRDLLAMTVTERKQALTNRAPESQRLILAKVQEYQALPADEREARLRATELRWYVLPLMSMPATNRPSRLDQIPRDLRPLVQARLAQWDVFPPPLQKQLLEDERNLQLYLQLEASTPTQQETILKRFPAAQRQEIEAGFQKWRALSEPERQRALVRVNQFFDLTPREKSKVLATLSDAERGQMERTLRNFERLPRAQRAQCINSFGRFASLSGEERLQFLMNAERWQAMTPGERETWRKLVSQAPLLPPIRSRTGASAPPLPPGFAPPVATNRN
jgi:hypothetical protein